MPASMNIDQAKGRDASGPITRKRFVKLDTASTDGNVKMCDTAGENAWGVALYTASAAEIARGKGASVITDGRAVVEAGGTLAMGDAVATDAVGRAITASGGQFILGYVDENPGGGTGSEVGVSLTLAGAKA